jgi:alkylation response protein AidB-like acyl-CoA dehydrogenase
MRRAQAAVRVTRGMANLRAQPAGRIYREALMFSLLGQTPELVAAHLARIIQAGNRKL